MVQRLIQNLNFLSMVEMRTELKFPLTRRELKTSYIKNIKFGIEVWQEKES